MTKIYIFGIVLIRIDILENDSYFIFLCEGCVYVLICHVFVV